MAIELGSDLPALELAMPGGEMVDLRKYLGKPLVLYFYPKDDTPGCTKEAQEFSALYPEFQALDAALLGVSADTPAKHQKFIAKYGLTIPLASDGESAALAAFGVWVEKSMYGKTYMGIERATFLFDAHGKLARFWRKVRVPGHAAEVLEAARGLTQVCPR